MLHKCQLWLGWYAWAHHFRKWPIIFCSMGHLGPPTLKKIWSPASLIPQSNDGWAWHVCSKSCKKRQLRWENNIWIVPLDQFYKDLYKFMNTHWGYCVVSLSKTLYPLHSTGSTQEDRKASRHDWISFWSGRKASRPTKLPKVSTTCTAKVFVEKSEKYS